MRITFLWVGKTRDPQISALVESYLQAVQKFVHVEIIATKPAKDRNPDEIRKKEGWALLKVLDRMKPKGIRVGLTVKGREYTSEVFARTLERWLYQGGARVSFVVGGEEGFSDILMDRLDEEISLSKMTLTHEMARLVLAEQVYRAMTILKGTGYHR